MLVRFFMGRRMGMHDCDPIYYMHMEKSHDFAAISDKKDQQKISHKP